MATVSWNHLAGIYWINTRLVVWIRQTTEIDLHISKLHIPKLKTVWHGAYRQLYIVSGSIVIRLTPSVALWANCKDFRFRKCISEGFSGFFSFSLGTNVEIIFFPPEIIFVFHMCDKIFDNKIRPSAVFQMFFQWCCSYFHQKCVKSAPCGTDPGRWVGIFASSAWKQVVSSVTRSLW